MPSPWWRQSAWHARLHPWEMPKKKVRKKPACTRKRRLSFNQEVLVAEYIKGSSGISPARATVPLVEMERRARQRRADENAAEQQQQAMLALLASEQQAAPKKKPRASASAAADRIAALIAGEMDATTAGATNGKGSAEPTDQDGDAVVARRDVPRKHHRDQVEPSAALAPVGDHAQVRAALGGLTTRLAGARRLLLRGTSATEVAQVLHALEDAFSRLRQSAPWLAADGLEALLEKAVSLQAQSLQGGGKASAKATLRTVMGLDGLYFELLYTSLTVLSPTATLVLRSQETKDPLRSPAAYFSGSHPAGWSARLGGEHATLLAEIMRKQRGDRVAGGPGWVCTFNGEQARLLAAPEQGDSSLAQTENSLLGLWRARHWEAVELLRASGAASAAEYERLLPTMNKESNGLRGRPRRKDRDTDPPAPPLVKQWRKLDRQSPCWMLAFAVPSARALATIARHGPIVEMGSGTGFWSALLRASEVDVSCFDVEPPSPEPAAAQNEFHGDCPTFVRVQRGTPATLSEARWRRHALLLCYPPPQSPMAAECLAAFSGDVLVHVGEWLGDTGSPAFEQALARDWQLEERLPLPCWGDTADDLTVWRRRVGAPRGAPAAGQHPVLCCDTCGKRGGLQKPAPGGAHALRRCAYCHVACYCSEACAAAGRDAHDHQHQLRMIGFSRALDFNSNDFQPCC